MLQHHIIHSEKYFNSGRHNGVAMKGKYVIYAFIGIILLAGFARADVNMAYFYSKNCLMCEKIQPFIEELENYSYVNIDKYEVTLSPYHPNRNDSLLENLSYAYHSVRDVPIIFFANEWFYFGNESMASKEKERLLKSLQELKNYSIPSPIKGERLVYPKPVSILLFYNSSKNESLDGIINAFEKNITFIRIDKLDVKYSRNMSIMEKLGKGETPLIFIGEKSYSLQIYNISYVVKEAKKYEKIGIDFPSAYEEKSICILFFYRSSCISCLRIKARLEALSTIYPLNIKEYDTLYKKNEELLMKYCAKYNITKPHNANIFIGDKYFYSEAQMNELEQEIKNWLGIGLSCPREGEVSEKLLQGLLFVVILGGLLDGINPCAFATLVFFIAYLERAKKEAIVPIGLSFAVGIYICYLMISVGLLEFMNVIRRAVSIYLYIAIGVAAIILGIFSLFDFFIIKKGGKAVLQLPLFLKKRRGRIIKRITEDKKITALAIIAFATGFAISALEFACTGQVLVPVVTMIQTSALAFIYLLIYNFMFIVPLLIILMLFHFGYSSARIGEMQKKSYGYAKLLIGIFLLVLGSVMLYHVFA